MKDIEAFKDISLFKGLSDNDLNILASHSIVKMYKKNTVIVNNGDETNSLYVILEGTLNAYLDDDHGKEIILSKMERGESFGELSLLSKTTRSASVISTTPCKLAVISSTVFMECLTGNSSIALNIIQSLIQRVQDLTKNVSNLALLDVYGRVINVLNKNAVKKEGKLVTERLTQQDIANMIGSSREMVSRILKDLKLGGYINMDSKTIIIERKLPEHW